jgi:hypothetical protein
MRILARLAGLKDSSFVVAVLKQPECPPFTTGLGLNLDSAH